MTISEISQIVEKAGRIIYFGLSSPKQISINQEFQNLYKEYAINSELQEYVKAIAQALNLHVITIERTGVFLSPKKGSPFAPRLSDIPVLGREKNKGQRLRLGCDGQRGSISFLILNHFTQKEFKKWVLIVILFIIT